MMKFQASKTYQTRSIGDSDCKITHTVSKRTAKTLTTVDQFKAVKTFRIFIDYHGNEAFKPWGSYSMAPIMTAEKEIAVLVINGQAVAETVDDRVILEEL